MICNMNIETNTNNIYPRSRQWTKSKAENGYYKKQLRKFMPVGERIRANDLTETAQQHKMGRNKVYECLKIMEEEGEVRKFREKPKEVYYVRFEDARIQNLIENFFSELNTTLADMPDEVKTIQTGVIECAGDFVKGSNLSQKEQDKVIKEIDRRSVGRVAYSLLLKHVFETIKNVEPELKNERFYVDAEGSFVPKDWVDEKIGFKKRNDWLTKVYSKQTE
jgi:hypothetical protein